MVYGPSTLDEGSSVSPSSTHSPSSRSADGDSAAASAAETSVARSSKHEPLLMPASASAHAPSRGRPATRSTTGSVAGSGAGRGEKGQRRAGDEEAAVGEHRLADKANAAAVVGSGASVQQQEHKSRGSGAEAVGSALGCGRLALFAVCTPFTPFPSLHALQLHAHRVLFKSRHRIDLCFSAIDLRCARDPHMTDSFICYE